MLAGSCLFRVLNIPKHKERAVRHLARNPWDKYVCAADSALRTLTARAPAGEPAPKGKTTNGVLSAEESREVGRLMRVNHVGEVCAQALYTAQAAVTRSDSLRIQLQDAAREEGDHLAWTRERLDALGARASLLNPLWYAGAFAIGTVASRISDRVSLGFVVETELQVAEHLQGHIDRIPAQDHTSRALLERMKKDEERHAAEATAAGALQLPWLARGVMRLAAGVMTRTARYV